MIGEKIRVRLELTTSNVSDLARFCNVSPQAAHQWINDVVEPRRKCKELITEFFKITIQELEYGASLSLTPVPCVVKVSARVSKVSDKLADFMISEELASATKSPQYMQGMRDSIVSQISNSIIESPYQAGTCQQDAYSAGLLHGARLMEKVPPTDI